MRKLIFIVLAILIAFPAYSQFGIKVGANTSTVPTYDISTGNNNIESLEDASWGFNAGIFYRFKVGPLYLQPEVEFTTHTYEYTLTGSTVSEVADQTWNRLEIPLLVGIKLGPIRLFVGPSATVPIGSPEALVDHPDFDEMYSGTTFGYQAGLGIDLFKRLTFDVKYGGSLADDSGDTVDIGGQTLTLDSRQPYFGLSAGIMF
jgi:hypothetical protein